MAKDQKKQGNIFTDSAGNYILHTFPLQANVRFNYFISRLQAQKRNFRKRMGRV